MAPRTFNGASCFSIGKRRDARVALRTRRCRSQARSTREGNLELIDAPGARARRASGPPWGRKGCHPGARDGRYGAPSSGHALRSADDPLLSHRAAIGTSCGPQRRSTMQRLGAAQPSPPRPSRPVRLRRTRAWLHSGCSRLQPLLTRDGRKRPPHRALEHDHDPSCLLATPT